jgi:hypothetical protein
MFSKIKEMFWELGQMYNQSLPHEKIQGLGFEFGQEGVKLGIDANARILFR